MESKALHPAVLSVAELRELAEAGARLGGSILAEARQRATGGIQEKALNDFVTEVDLASEAAIVSFLRERHPEHGILAEEAATVGALAGGIRAGAGGAGPDGSRAGDAEPAAGTIGSRSARAGAAESDSESRGAHPGASASAPSAVEAEIGWIIDPLDGTKNFIHGFPAYAVSVAARGREGVLAGAIYDPNRDELFSAGRGLGATLNGEPIRVSSPSALGHTLVGTGFPFRLAHLRELYLESFHRVLAVVSDVRRAGSACLDLAYVACGRLDGFWELGLSPWDMAAGWLLNEEAGGVVSDDQGGGEVFERGHIVAGGPWMHAKLLEILRPVFGGKVPPRGNAI